MQQIKQLKDELEEVRRNCNEMKSKQSDVKAQNDAHLLEEKARLIVDKQNLEEKTVSYKNALREFEVMKIRHTQLVEENNGLVTKVPKKTCYIFLEFLRVLLKKFNKCSYKRFKKKSQNRNRTSIT